MKAFVAVYGLVGAGAVVYGIYHWSPPAAWVVGGAFVILDAWRMSNAKSSD